MAKHAPLPIPKIITDDRMPIDAIALVSATDYVVMRGLRQDCTFPRCQLSLGHPSPHCLEWRSVYLMVDDDGNVLREL